MPAVKLNLKDKLRENELDLSMCDLQEVPVKEISLIKKAVILDLSNNQLSVLGNNFAPSLTFLVKVDLSQNRLKELPENFGELKNLKSLDLYNNKLVHLPLSLGECKSLRWLDLKNNPLSPAFAEVAGPCIDTKQCQECAKRIVPFLKSLREQLTKEHERRQAQKKRDKQEASQQQRTRGNQENMGKNKKRSRNPEASAVEQQNIVEPPEEPVQEPTVAQPVEDRLTKAACLRIIIRFLAYLSILALYVLTISYFFNERWYNIAAKWISETWNKFLDMLPSVIAGYCTSFVDFVILIVKYCSGIVNDIGDLLSRSEWLYYLATKLRDAIVYVHSLYMHCIFVGVQMFKVAFLDY